MYAYLYKTGPFLFFFIFVFDFPVDVDVVKMYSIASLYVFTGNGTINKSYYY